MTENGTVKFYNHTKKFGFIVGEDGQEYFFHYTDIINGANLDKGNIISFEPTNSTKGLCAREVKYLRESKYSDEE